MLVSKRNIFAYAFYWKYQMLMSFIFQMKLTFRNFSYSNGVPLMVEFPKVSGGF